MRKGDYAAAAAALDGLLLDHPGDARAQLYLGIARLFQDEPQNALEFLRPLELNAPPDIGAEAAWYSLVGIARLRDPSGVENEARALCVSGKPTARRACAALEALGKDR
jgi:cytochrome c-type biogenesis protein CcmH/NrfG